MQKNVGPERPDDRSDDDRIDLSQGLPINGKKGKIVLNKSAIVTVALIVAICVVIGLIVSDYTHKKNSQPKITEQGHYTENGAYISDIAKPYAEDAAPTVAPLRPQSAGEGLLPVFYEANTEKKRIAVTISGKVNEDQMRLLMQTASETGARFTFFPTGEMLRSDPEMWITVYLMGHEIESAGWSGARYLAMNGEEEMAQEIDRAIEALRNCINAQYQLHFIRTNDLYDDEYLPLHAILKSRGVYGIARQSVQMSKSTSQDAIRSGAIINMQIGEQSAEDLCRIIEYIVSQGYEIVSMNTLFEYPPNVLSTPESE